MRSQRTVGNATEEQLSTGPGSLNVAIIITGNEPFASVLCSV